VDEAHPDSEKNNSGMNEFGTNGKNLFWKQLSSSRRLRHTFVFQLLVQRKFNFQNTDSRIWAGESVKNSEMELGQYDCTL
jgi:hypothetical protein